MYSRTPLDYLSAVGEEYAKRLRAAIRERKDARKIRRITPDGNVVAEIDLIAERILRDVLLDLGTPVIIVSEDARMSKLGERPEFTIIADPLDGTTNFIRGVPFYSFSLALAKPEARPRLSDVFAGLVMDLCHNEVFLAQYEEGSRGLKARTNDLQTKPLVSLYAYGVKIDPKHFNAYQHLIGRGLGSLALETCYVARGRIDAVVDIRGVARAVDIAGAIPILKEAGGKITDPRGRDLDVLLDALPKLSFIAARSDSVLKRIVSLL
ncbi:MAG: inositol monophosphatase family protein [Candidatus Bathyarchaeia archaeon]